MLLLNDTLKAFLFPHDCAYLGGLLVFILEFWIEVILWPNLKRGFGLVAWIGIFLMIIGESLRGLAHWTLRQHFSLIIETTKEQSRELITSGIYSTFRHPSYTGFFWFTIGGQLLLCNPTSSVAIYFVLCSFFKSRIREEEMILTEFYPDKYSKYRERTYVLIPFL